MKSFLVVGLGAFGEAVAQTLYSLEQTVVAVDIHRDKVERAREFTSEVVEADATDRGSIEQIVENLGAENIGMAVVGVGRRLDASILVCLFLKELGVERIVAKVLTADHARILHHLGVEDSVFPEADAGVRLAHRLAHPNLVDLLPLGFGIGVMDVPAPEKFVGRSLRELEIRSKYDLLVVGIRRKAAGKVEMMPAADAVIEAGDVLVVLGSEAAAGELPK